MRASGHLAHEVAHRLKDAGFGVFYAGGCVRDRLLERPVKDIDLATSAQPGEVRGLFPDAIEVGAHFGVVLLRRGGEQVEVATFRSEGDYRDGRRPEQVTFETDPRRDAQRRDFTINGMFEDPFTGEVLDYVGGHADLRAGILRAIGDPVERFQEDHLRLLRAVRFAARLGFALEAGTRAAMKTEAASIARISMERVRDELALILTEGGARRGLELMEETGLLRELLPEVLAMKGVEQPPQFHPEGDVWTHTLLVMEAVGVCPLPLALGALLHDVGKPPTMTREDRIRFNGHADVGARMAREILTRLRFPNDVVDRAVSHVANHMKFSDWPRMKESTFKRFVRAPGFGELLSLHRADLAGAFRPLDSYESLKQRWQALPPEALRPPALLTGNDLLAMGYRAGPAFAEMLAALEEEQLSGRVHTREDARRFVLERFPSGPVG
jgi:poly(A) polymerase